MAKKFNMVAAKEFLIKHGEKVVLGVCAFIAISFGIMGLMRAANAGRAEGSASKSWPEAFRELKTRIERDRDSVQPKPMDEATEKKLLATNYEWDPRTSSYEPIPYLTQPDTNLGKKRFNPAALAVNPDPDTMKLQYIASGILVHDYNPALKTINTLNGAVAGDGAGMPMPMPVIPIGGKKGAAAGAKDVAVGPYAHDVRPSRMIVGTLVFPLKKLVADYVKALRLEGQGELFANPEDLPHFEGFTLMRFEILPNGEPANTNGELIIGYDKKAKQVQVSTALRKMLRDAVYDDQLPVFLEPYLFEGLSMPMPKLAYGRYPKPNIPGIDLSGWEEEPVDDKKGPGKLPGAKDKGGIRLPGAGKKGATDMPMGGDPLAVGKKGALGGDGTLKAVKYSDIKAYDPHLANRLFNKDFDKDFNFFHALGIKAGTALIDKKGAAFPAMAQMPDGMGGPGAKNETRFFSAWDVPLGDEVPIIGGAGAGAVRPMKGGAANFDPGQGGAAAEFKTWDRDALVRFIDIDVEPGKTYQYAIQVRISNPNYKKPLLVAFNALASNPELPLHSTDSWVWTPTITVPHEYFIYAVDQTHLDVMAVKGNMHDKALIVPKDQTALQVHQWMKYKDDRASGMKHAIGDWAIAKRLLVRRGEEIGLGAGVLVPIWRETKDAFELPMEIRDPRKPKEMTSGMRIDLRPIVIDKVGKEITLPPPVLVDFSGGRRYKSANTVEEESATDVLILDSTGKLVLRNSRIDSDTAILHAREREERVSASRSRILDIMNENFNAPAAKGPMGPGAKGP